ncbi:hypothetical protein FPV67DRAFT_1715344 [Lyophyllum atratum]|nr:hypothetical protein FPV67DRAFT_1715344 [Lyophyllum atratum]
MSSAFPFVPRTLSSAKRKSTQHVSPATASAVRQAPGGASQLAVPSATRPPKNPQASNKGQYTNEDYTVLLCLALSDYALWSDPDLRRKLEWSSDASSSEQGEGFFPLSHLLEDSKLLAPLGLGNSQVPIARALRSNAADVLEVRLLVSDPSASTWFGGQTDSKDIGAYEVRRKDWTETLTGPSRGYSRTDWERRTVYVENIPVQHRTVPTIARFLVTLLEDYPSSTAPLTRVQSIIFPPHHQDKPDDRPTCKGFALLVLKDDQDAEFLLNRWRWDRHPSPTHHPAKPEDREGRTEVQEAVKYGFRALSKLRWDKLKEEYLSYRGRLVAEINAHDVVERPIPVVSTSKAAPEPVTKPPLESEHDEPDAIRTLDYSSPYPFNSLVFVRNIHPETNKTTLRKFFATALESSLASGELQTDGLDYVDFNKGMDSVRHISLINAPTPIVTSLPFQCHLRLATPKHAQLLVDHFVRHPTSHARGLDEVGVPADGKSPPVVMELVTGRREELYWEKVPEKVRRQAVQKAIASMQTSPSGKILDGDVNGGETRKRKRRKH